MGPPGEEQNHLAVFSDSSRGDNPQRHALHLTDVPSDRRVPLRRSGLSDDSGGEESVSVLEDHFERFVSKNGSADLRVTEPVLTEPESNQLIHFLYQNHVRNRLCSTPIVMQTTRPTSRKSTKSTVSPGQFSPPEERSGLHLTSPVQPTSGVVVHHGHMPATTVQQTPGTPTIDVQSAARFLGVSERTVRRLVASRAIGHRHVVGLIRFTQEDLDDYVESVRVVAEV